MVICTTCGQDNPAHLVFCQACGQRLGPRVAPPTPPIGLTPPQAALGGLAPGQAALAAPAGAPGSHVSPAAGTFALPRPPTPMPASSPSAGPRPAPSSAAQKASLAATIVDPRPPQMEPPPPDSASAPKRVCPICATANDGAVRYCQSCGTTLQRTALAPVAAPPPFVPSPQPAPAPTAFLAPQPAAPPPVPAPAPPPFAAPAPAPFSAPAPPPFAAPAPAPFSAPAPPAVSAPAPPPVSAPAPAAPPPVSAPPAPAPAAIQPARVVDLGAGAARVAPDTTRVCARCRGTCEATAQFCKFCGSPLTDALPVAPAAPAALAAPPPSPPPPAIAPAPAPAVAAPAGPAPAPPAAATRVAVAAAPARGRLVVVAKDGGEGPSYPLLDQVDIGREEGNIVIAEDRYLSPRHARLTRKNGQLYVRDLGSVNGVYLRLSSSKQGNGASAAQSGPPSASRPNETSVPLQDQDLFLVGQQVIRFEIVRDADEGLGPAVEHGTLLFGTPTTPRYARLCQRTIEGVTRDVYYIAKRETVLGRESGDIVFTEDPFLSRRHAAIRASERAAAAKDASPPHDRHDRLEFSLVDLGSSNGTFVQLRGEAALKDGDEIRIGQQLFRVDLTHDAAGSQGS